MNQAKFLFKWYRTVFLVCRLLQHQNVKSFLQTKYKENNDLNNPSYYKKNEQNKYENELWFQIELQKLLCMYVIKKTKVNILTD